MPMRAQEVVLLFIGASRWGTFPARPIECTCTTLCVVWFAESAHTHLIDAKHSQCNAQLPQIDFLCPRIHPPLSMGAAGRGAIVSRGRGVGSGMAREAEETADWNNVALRPPSPSKLCRCNSTRPVTPSGVERQQRAETSPPRHWAEVVSAANALQTQPACADFLHTVPACDGVCNSHQGRAQDGATADTQMFVGEGMRDVQGAGQGPTGLYRRGGQRGGSHTRRPSAQPLDSWRSPPAPPREAAPLSGEVTPRPFSHGVTPEVEQELRHHGGRLACSQIEKVLSLLSPQAHSYNVSSHTHTYAHSHTQIHTQL